MIKLDLTGAVTQKAIEKYADTVKQLASKMENLEAKGFEFLGWKDLPNNYNKVEFEDIKKEAQRLWRAGIDTLVVIGIGGSFAGAKAAIDMVLGEYPQKRKMEIIWVGESLSSTNLQQKMRYVENRNFAINVISKSGTTTEPAVAFRLFKQMLETKVGVKEAAKRIVATTDANRGALLSLARDNGYKTFIIPDNIGGRFSVLTPVGLLPMACAGLDIDAVMEGARKGWKQYTASTIVSNDAYRYAVARDILAHTHQVEMMVQYEPQMKAFNEWWKQLAGESEGKEGKGIFPASAIFTTDLHSLGQFIQEGSKVLFETVLTVAEPKYDIRVSEDKANVDGLNYLTTKTVHEINHIAFKATIDAHVKSGNVPNIHIEFDALDESSFGELSIFFMRAVAMTAYLQGVNPFNQPGVEIYKQNMFKILGKPNS